MGIAYEVSDGIAIVRFDRPDKLNALTLAMYRELGDAFISARDDKRVRVVILTASGQRAFCVGADLGESIPALMDDKFDISQWDDAHLKNLRLYKPVLCAINGLCLGGGFEIMLGTDIRIASDTAKFALPEPSLGIVPAGGTLTFDELASIDDAVGHARTMEAQSYHWRARVATNSPVFPNTAWFSAPGSNVTEAKLRKPALQFP